MKVHFISGYYSDLAHKNKKRRPEDYWDAYFFCWGVKIGSFKRPFNIHDGKGRKTAIAKSNFHLAREAFGKRIERGVSALNGDNEVVIVPVPSKDGVVGASSFRSLDMAQEALNGTKLASRINGGLRWKKQLPKAHEGARPSRAELEPLLNVDTSLKSKKVVLVDDLVTKGSSLLACKDALEKAGAEVIGAVVCGKTIYELDTPHFGEQEFDLTSELADWAG